jgi:protein-S-isoprenylcysteine O-methyltransferase Ste14
MSKLFRVFVFPVLVALPMVLASLAPLRFLTDPRCVGAFVLMILGLAVENAIVSPESVRASNDKSQSSRDKRSFELSALTNVACFYLPAYDYMNLHAVVPRNTVTLVVGATLMVAGEVMRIIALRALGRFFTMRVAILDGHTVVRAGPYRFVRHPAYTGWFLLSLGFGIYFGSILGVAGTTLFVLVLGWRVTVEERALRETLGDAYRQYMHDVPSRFLPGIF